MLVLRRAKKVASSLGAAVVATGLQTLAAGVDYARTNNPPAVETHMKYDLVFDVENQPFPMLFIYFSLAFALAFATLLAATSSRLALRAAGRAGLSRRMRIVVWIFRFGLLLSSGFVVLGFIGTRRSIERAREVLRNHEESVADGTVASVCRAPNGEKVIVDGVKFVVPDLTGNPGYAVTTKHGGVLRTGTKVRIHHWNGWILRLEAERE